MRAIDTNVIVRLFARDDPAQLQSAVAILDDQILILPTVVMETVWVLQASYSKKRDEISRKLAELLGHENAILVSANALKWALQHYATQGDFADLLHIALANEADATSFASFDKQIKPGLLADLSLELERLV
jgi:predicted nucleic-acid-binding protein